VAGAVEVEYDLSRRKAKKVKKILEHKDISLTDTPTG
jgi:hypothetical protein